mmetsp:Transcript_18528/g.34369  ORF Transcript_18528/g.34369 Transcript_18528/m.34369 type:complete len:235 (-) Transcript_18528:1466-2170(-)
MSSTRVPRQENPPRLRHPPRLLRPGRPPQFRPHRPPFHRPPPDNPLPPRPRSLPSLLHGEDWLQGKGFHDPPYQGRPSSPPTGLHPSDGDQKRCRRRGVLRPLHRRRAPVLHKKDRANRLPLRPVRLRNKVLGLQRRPRPRRRNVHARNLRPPRPLHRRLLHGRRPPPQRGRDTFHIPRRPNHRVDLRRPSPPYPRRARGPFHWDGGQGRLGRGKVSDPCLRSGEGAGTAAYIG